MTDDKDFSQKTKEPEVILDSAYQRIYVGEGKIPFKDRLVFWVIVGAGIAAGTLFFLFFLTFFIYVILPVTLFVIVWNLIKSTWSH